MPWSPVGTQQVQPCWRSVGLGRLVMQPSPRLHFASPAVLCHVFCVTCSVSVFCSANPQWSTADAEIKLPLPAPGGSPGRGWVALTTSQTDPPPRLHLLGGNWRPWHLKSKLSLSQKVGCMHGRSCHEIWGVSQCIWAELQRLRLADFLPPWPQ